MQIVGAGGCLFDGMPAPDGPPATAHIVRPGLIKWVPYPGKKNQRTIVLQVRTCAYQWGARTADHELDTRPRSRISG